MSDYNVVQLGGLIKPDFVGSSFSIANFTSLKHPCCLIASRSLLSARDMDEPKSAILTGSRTRKLGWLFISSDVELSVGKGKFSR